MTEATKDFGGFCVMCVAIGISSIAFISLIVLVWAQLL